MAKEAIFYFEKAGLYTTLQGAGNKGQQHFGLPIGGPMDQTSAKIANWLVGNEAQAAVLEITMMGPEIIVKGDCKIAITGADMSPKLNDKPVSMYNTIAIKSGSKISFGRLNSGCRTYLAIGGKISENKLWSNNVSYALNNDNFVFNKKIEQNSSLSFKTNGSVEIKNHVEKRPLLFNNKIDVRVVPGPEYNLFSKQAIKSFFDNKHYISNQSDRIGYRLRETLKHCNQNQEIISSGIIPGTIQVTSSGKAIILMNDAPTIGGYARIANIISTYMDNVAQLKPGDQISFSI
ncbi:MAG: biotin-dependent carboxyltransferase family protein [Saprospiraceae bacterium]|nr:biotin-dependent carboxyltransferase family protein [Saprospiraceae bacterium]